MEFSLGFGRESVGQEFFAEFDVKTRVGAGIGAGKLLLGPTTHLRSHLAESVFLVVALDTLRRSLRRRAAWDNSAGASGRRQGVEHHLRLSVVRTLIERGAQFACRADAIAGLGKSYSHVEVIVGIAGIVLNCSLEILSGFFLAAAGGDHAEVVVDLGQRQACGYKLKGAFRFCEVSMRVGGESEIEICFASDCARRQT